MRQLGDAKYYIWAEGVYCCWHHGRSRRGPGRQRSSELECMLCAHVADLLFSGLRFRACGSSSRSSIPCQAMVQAQITCSRRVEGSCDRYLWHQWLSRIVHGPEGLLLELVMISLYSSSLYRFLYARLIWMNDWLASLSWMSEST